MTNQVAFKPADVVRFKHVDKSGIYEVEDESSHDGHFFITDDSGRSETLVHGDEIILVCKRSERKDLVESHNSEEAD